MQRLEKKNPLLPPGIEPRSPGPHSCIKELIIKIKDVTFQVLTAASMKFRIVFWDVPPCTSQKTILNKINDT
jgi:hypothetical protein